MPSLLRHVAAGLSFGRRRRGEMAQRIRMVGVDKVLFGSDAATPTNMRPREAWAALKALPLTKEEIERVAANVAPYLR